MGRVLRSVSYDPGFKFGQLIGKSLKAIGPKSPRSPPREEPNPKEAITMHQSSAKAGGVDSEGGGGGPAKSGSEEVSS